MSESDWWGRWVLEREGAVPGQSGSNSTRVEDFLGESGTFQSKGQEGPLNELHNLPGAGAGGSLIIRAQVGSRMCSL